jgi:hypothetical protein
VRVTLLKQKAGPQRMRTGFFITQKIRKVSAPSEDEEKKSTAEHAETAECKQAKKKWNNGTME